MKRHRLPRLARQLEVVVVHRPRTRRASITWPAKSAEAAAPACLSRVCANTAPSGPSSEACPGAARARALWMRSACSGFDPASGGWQRGSGMRSRTRSRRGATPPYWADESQVLAGVCLLVVVRAGTLRTDGVNCGALQQKRQSWARFGFSKSKELRKRLSGKPLAVSVELGRAPRLSASAMPVFFAAGRSRSS
jgi:hypothetical protein